MGVYISAVGTDLGGGEASEAMAAPRTGGAGVPGAAGAVTLASLARVQIQSKALFHLNVN
jgi:hypothetical protein